MLRQQNNEIIQDKYNYKDEEERKKRIFIGKPGKNPFSSFFFFHLL
jgi:hypothetical protein